MRRTPSLTERGPHGVERTCIDYLVAEKIPHVRLNRREQAVYAALGFSVQNAGAADCIAFVPAGRAMRLPLDCYAAEATWEIICVGEVPRLADVAVPFMIDWKRQTGAKYSAGQLETQRMCRENGIPHAFIHSLDELKAIIPPRISARS